MKIEPEDITGFQRLWKEQFNAEINEQSQPMVKSKLKKFFMIVDIAQCCVDSYLKVSNKFAMVLS